MEHSIEYSATWARDKYNNDPAYKQTKQQRNSEWAKQNRDKKNTNLRNNRQKKRQRCIEYLGGKCVGCGTTENLQFDHLDRSQKQHNISRIVDWKFERIVPELDKCRLLCDDCHQIKTRAEADNQAILKGYVLESVEHIDGKVFITYK